MFHSRRLFVARHGLTFSVFAANVIVQDTRVGEATESTYLKADNHASVTRTAVTLML